VTKIATSPCCQCGSLWAVFSMSPRGSKNFMPQLIEGSAGTLARFLKWRRSREEKRYLRPIPRRAVKTG
jgi:hypothetical protein